jgi:basic membrane protein A
VLLILPAAAACSGRHGRLKVGLAYAVGGPGDDGFNDLALAGLDRADKELHAVASVKALTAGSDESEDDRYHRLALLCQAGYDPVVAVGFSYAGSDPATGPLARAAQLCPHTHFAIVDDDTVRQPNVADLVFANQEGAYLMGVIAATRTHTGIVGLVGACPVTVINTFVAGYTAGARAADTQVVVRVSYASQDPSRCDFTDPGPARAAAAALYAAGADIVFQVAGGAGLGVFQAADAAGRLAIGVDADQYRAVGPPLNHVIITSMIKRVDVAVYDFIRDVSAGDFVGGVHRFGLADGGIGYATSGGQITDMTGTLEDYRKKIVTGRIVVPTTP